MRTLLTLMIICIALGRCQSADGERPDILVMVSDDHGDADSGFQGGVEIPTPHLDAFASGL
jgi:hypothetical protein